MTGSACPPFQGTIRTDGGHGASAPLLTLQRVKENPRYSKSPPAAKAVVPCSRNALMTLRPTRHLCTSSGPSTSRCDRTCVYHSASTVSWLKPSAPCNWIAVSITWCTICARRSEEHTSELQSHLNLVCRLLLEKKKKKK